MNLRRIVSLFFFFSLVGNTNGTNSTILSNKPNIVWIIIEDLSPDLGCYGNDIVRTRHLDSLAAMGKKYTNVFATGVACSPSRTAFVTGFYQNYLGAYHMRYPEELKPPLPDTVYPVHVRLRGMGYQTANIRDFPGNGKTDWMFKYNTDSYDTEHWDDLEKENPFFARINLRLTHRPFVEDTVHPIDPEILSLPPYVPDQSISREDWKAYYESIQVMDRQVGGIISELKNRDLDENTVIFIFSDHGRPMTRAKNYLYDSGLQVPLIVCALDKDTREIFDLRGENHELYSLVDVTETTLRLAGGSGDSTQGISLFSDSGREYVWAAADRIGEIFFKSRMIRNRRYKYIRNINRDFSINEATTSYTRAHYPAYHLYRALDQKRMLNAYQEQMLKPLAAEELYDIHSDPFEVHNLAGDTAFSVTLDRMRKRLDNFTDEIKDRGMEQDSEEIIRAFEKYGKDSRRRNEDRILQLKRTVFQAVK